MSQDLFYRDIKILHGEDRVMVSSGLFRALHGHQKKHQHALVTVPISLHGREVSITQDGRIPDGFRVLSEHESAVSSIELTPMVDDFVKIQRVICVDASHAQQHVLVQRIHVPSNAEIRRYDRRKEKHAEHNVEQVVEAVTKNRLERSRPGIHFWLQKDGAKYPFFMSVRVIDVAVGFKSVNTYGCGTVPMVDF